MLANFRRLLRLVAGTFINGVSFVVNLPAATINWVLWQPIKYIYFKLRVYRNELYAVLHPLVKLMLAIGLFTMNTTAIGISIGLFSFFFSRLQRILSEKPTGQVMGEFMASFLNVIGNGIKFLIIHSIFNFKLMFHDVEMGLKLLCALGVVIHEPGNLKQLRSMLVSALLTGLLFYYTEAISRVGIQVIDLIAYGTFAMAAFATFEIGRRLSELRLSTASEIFTNLINGTLLWLSIQYGIQKTRQMLPHLTTISSRGATAGLSSYGFWIVVSRLQDLLDWLVEQGLNDIGAALEGLFNARDAIPLLPRELLAQQAQAQAQVAGAQSPPTPGSDTDSDEEEGAGFAAELAGMPGPMAAGEDGNFMAGVDPLPRRQPQ